MSSEASLTVYFDGGCPLCRREIAFYRRLDRADDVRWVDVSSLPPGEVGPGLTRERALARFHVRLPDGRLASGGAAFAHLWTALPAVSLAGRILRLPPFVWCLNLAYPVFLRLRPRLQRLFD